MAVAHRATSVVTDPATVPEWVLSFASQESHWMSLVNLADEPANWAPGRPWSFFEADRIYREVSRVWLTDHAPDLNLYDLWDEARRRSGHEPIHRHASAQLKKRAAEKEQQHG